MHVSIADWTGTIGVAVLLAAFGLNLLHKISQDSLVYIVMNCAGAALSGIASILLSYIPFIVLESAWTAVSLVALVSYIRKRSH